MTVYEVQDSETGKKLRLEGDSPPTEAELEQIFSQFREEKPRALTSRIGKAKDVFEAGLQAATGAVSQPFAGFAGIGAAIAPGGRTGAEAVEDVSNALTFQSDRPGAQELLGTISKPFQAIERGADLAGEVSGDPEDVLGATAVKTALLGAPSLLGLRTMRQNAKVSPREAALRAGQEKGLVAPPGSVKGSGLLEGVGGKIKTQQLASSRNQPVTNAIAARSIGLADDTPLSVDVLEAVRRDAGRSFEAVRQAGRIKTDGKFIEQLSNATSRFRSAARDFPKVAKNEVVDLIDDIKKPEFDASSGVDVISLLRNRADVAFRNGDAGAGRAFRQAAGAVEDVIDRHLAKTDVDPALLQGYRNARAQIAKTYTIQDALEGSNVSALKLGAALKKGKPLSGDLKVLAEFAQEFPKAVQVAKESFPTFSPLDTFVQASSGAGALAAGNPALAIPAAVSLSRPLFREAALSRLGQGPGINVLPGVGLSSKGNALLGGAVTGGGNALLEVEPQ